MASGGCRPTTCKPKSHCSAPCCCRAKRSPPRPKAACAPTTSTSRPTATSTPPCRRCTRRGEPVDPVTVADELRRADLLDAAGGPGVLVDLQLATPGGVVGRPLRPDHHRARPAAEAHHRGRRDRRDRLRPARRRRQGHRPRRVDGVRDQPAARRRLRSQAERTPPDALDELEKLFERGSRVTGVATGYTDLDSCCRACSRPR